MTLLSAYLSKSKVKKVLSSKPGEEGFSLIELVVVVAVLAVLSAIAIPQFTNISQKARAAAASNTIATMAKECAVKLADDPATAKVVVPTLQGYSNITLASGAVAAGSLLTCAEDAVITAVSTATTLYPTFTYTFATGAKTCVASGAALSRGCSAAGNW